MHHVAVMAQAVPDAGRIQRDNEPRPLPPSRPQVPLELPSSLNDDSAAGGATVQIASVRFTGNTLLPSETLQAAVSELHAKPVDLAGLKAIADRVSAVYLAAGYPFVRGYLLPQEINDGVLQVGVIEGRYGRVEVAGDERLAPLAAPFLAALRPADPIASGPLERRLLILADQPGITVSALIRSGAAEGEGDLQVTISRESRLRIDTGIDNHGSRYTGKQRLRVDAEVDSALRLGDQLVVRGILSEQDLWLGSLVYGLPVGVSGLRAAASFSRTAYELGEPFESLGASGTADVAAVDVSYPVLRSPTTNFGLSATVQRKTLRDELRVIDSNERKSSWSVPLAARFDSRGGSGSLTYGVLTVTFGRLRLNGDSLTSDVASGRSADGAFRKWNVDIARVQPLGQSRISAFLRISAQRADRNLDSSEKFSLGGPSAVRAYPTGEGNGDEGAFAQLELRVAAGPMTPFVFFDAGSARVNARTSKLLAAPASNGRSVSGVGLGTKLAYKGWDAEAIAAWAVDGGAPEAESTSGSPRVWLSAHYRFGAH